MGTVIALRWEVRRWWHSRRGLGLAAAVSAAVTAAAVLATGTLVGRSFFSLAVTFGLMLVMLLAPMLALVVWLEVMPSRTVSNADRPSPRIVVLAKLLAVSLQTLALGILVLLPAFASVAVGLVSAHQLLASVAVVAAAGLLMVSVTTCAICRLRAPGLSLVIAYTVVLATTFVATAVAAFLPTSDTHLWPPELSEIAGYVNPLAALLAATRHQVPAYGWLFPVPLGDYLSSSTAGRPRLPVWSVYLGASAVIAMALNALTVFSASPNRRSE